MVSEVGDHLGVVEWTRDEWWAMAGSLFAVFVLQLAVAK